MEEKLSNVSQMIGTAVKKSRRLKEGVLKADWEKIVGKICEKCQPEYIKNGILYIKAEGNVYIHHLALEKDKYVEKINEYFQERVVTDIEIISGKLDENREEYLVKNENIPVKPQEKKIKESIKKEIKNMKEELNIPQGEEINFAILEKVAHLQKMAIEREKYLLSHGFKKCKVCGMLYEGKEDFCRVCIENGEAKKYLKARGLIQEVEE